MGWEGGPGSLGPNEDDPGGLSPDGGGPGGLRPGEGGPDGVGVATAGLKPGALGPGATGAEAGAGALVPGVAPPPPCLAWIRADRRILTS